MADRSLLWRRDDAAGMEVAFVRFDGQRMSAHGAAIGSIPLAYHLSYRLETGDRYVTRRLIAATGGTGWRRELELERDDEGVWTVRASSEGDVDLPEAGGDAAPLAGCPDCDIGYSPLTNSPPVLRHGLHREAGAVDLDAAWISVPDLAVRRLEQRYTHVEMRGGSAVVRYQTRSGSFTADLEIDREGFVVRYPRLATREAG